MMRYSRNSLRRAATAALGVIGLAALAQPAQAQSVPVSLLDSVPIGSGGLCEAQIRSPQSGDGLFDRRYLVLCRDASSPVGSLAVLEGRSEAELLADARRDGATCVADSGTAAPQGLSSASSYTCTAPETGLQTRVVIGQQGPMTYVANGVAAYSDALSLGLANLASDTIMPGTISIPLTEASDARAFARAQAEAISAQAALAEAYRRANAGEFAEAAEFFAASAEQLSGQPALEARLNAALQQSNLGNYLEAALIFIAVRDEIGENPILTRLARNFEALDGLNRDAPAEALLTLDQPLPGNAGNLDSLRTLEVSSPLSNRLIAEQENAISGAVGQLTLLERADLLDAQAEYIRATALRSQGRMGEARETLLRAQEDLLSVRDGRIVSIMWLRAQVLTELAEIDELGGDLAGAEALHRQSVALIEGNYPGSPALVSARAQLAGFLARNGREDEALALYGDLVDDAESKPSAALRRLLTPYFNLLAERSGDADSAASMFAASQLLLRPGLAQTQAVLARELSGGSDEASQLFRRSINIGRAIEQLRGDIAQRELLGDTGDSAAVELAAMRSQLETLQTRQLQLQQELADYPRYRVVSEGQMDLADLQASLRPGEAYYKLVMLDEHAYAIFAESDAAYAYRVEADAAEIDAMVDTLRDSIAIDMAGQTITYPFEIATARQLYLALFGPVDGRLRETGHLIFEPDGAMLRLPANLLVMDDASVERYAARTEDPDADAYDFRGTQWLGREIQVSTAVSPTGFRDVRSARASDARGEYLGLGQNLPLGEAGFPTGTRSAGGSMSDRCDWSASVWNNPITATELRTATQIVEADGGEAAVLTDAAFTDTALLGMDELDEYRILHFATHGLVTSPQPDCPPRPALLTSFGDEDSDGLLSFAEIFDLRIDADLVILSACNTASAGGLVASREAGISGTGDFALDGLVRAFVGAGGRTVVASHWPVPDDYNATQRLISGFFQAGEGTPTTEALRQAQLSLMDDVETSHPFYWSAFAVVGDGAIALRRP
ncbi:CHAT domain-containing protein [Aurantiacibacter sp. MUD11]|uniref:CHAT domain-containing protein n=1 Tax=Aurantiacibacter sp. MUD11 TaxID=3003265 RepID=UPI0022AB3A80|nr:CHAT domain-containing protein [Aurantiacibacter sp. MUD11]WAT16840.1 CHAT domain-containing protein [Aurantiacibacter sp. MUD11]